MKKIFSLALRLCPYTSSSAWPTSKLHLNQPSHAGSTAGIVRAVDHGARRLLWNPVASSSPKLANTAADPTTGIGENGGINGHLLQRPLAPRFLLSHFC